MRYFFFLFFLLLSPCECVLSSLTLKWASGGFELPWRDEKSANATKHENKVEWAAGVFYLIKSLIYIQALLVQSMKWTLHVVNMCSCLKSALIRDMPWPWFVSIGQPCPRWFLRASAGRSHSLVFSVSSQSCAALVIFSQAWLDAIVKPIWCAPHETRQLSSNNIQRMVSHAIGERCTVAASATFTGTTFFIKEALLNAKCISEAKVQEEMDTWRDHKFSNKWPCLLRGSCTKEDKTACLNGYSTPLVQVFFKWINIS